VASTSGSGELPDDKTSEVESIFADSNPAISPEEQSEQVSSTMKVLASIEQGYQLRVDAEGLGFPLNPDFGGGLVIAAKNKPAVEVGQGLTFTVLGPMQPEVEALRKQHNEWLKKLKKEGREPPEVLAAYVDKSVPNLSSLVLLAKLGGKTMLLTGDARGDKILQGLEMAGLLAKGGTIKVDLLKVPHHGSSNNLDDDFFKRIIARHYVFSGDGEHGNPERESLEMLFKARGDGEYTIHLTYPVKEIDDGRKKDWNKEQGKEKNKKKKNPKQKVRPAWTARQSLQDFFNSHVGMIDKVKVVGEDKPHVIDLLDPLGF
jgi:hypothetical protein